jgi:NAD(P)-dependent dehydrogenase (short-subunit alcohol dehydrogenase family)
MRFDEMRFAEMRFAEMRFDGRVAIVTGAGRGLGRDHALLLAQRGAKVVVNDVAADHAHQTVADIIDAGGQAVADIHSVVDGSEKIVETSLESFGRLDVLVNNAGRGGPTGTLEQTTDAQVATIVSTHLVGTYSMCRAAWPHLRSQQYGRILITSSAAAVGSLGMPAYSMAKAGLIGLGRSLALEGAPDNITVNILMPIGYTRSAALNPHEDTRRWMEENFPPHLCAPTAAFLVHEDVPCSGEILTTGAGRAALIATVGVPGWSGGQELTMEGLRDHWSEVVNTEGFKPLRYSREELDFYTGPATWRG